MDSSGRLVGRERTMHQIIGGGLVADVVLWRQRNISLGVLTMALLVWLVFERSGYTLLSLTSNVLLLLLTILFVWSKAAALLNRPIPPLPNVYITEELVAEVGELVRININSLITVCRDVALGKDSRLFFRVAACLFLTSIVGCMIDLVSLCYISLIVLFSIPVLYERYEDHIDSCLNCLHIILHRAYVKMDEYIMMLKKMDIEKLQ